jgi:hypothetical protein
MYYRYITAMPQYVMAMTTGGIGPQCPSEMPLLCMHLSPLIRVGMETKEK